MNRRYADGNFECIVIYGRRRVGKTALINEFCKDKPVIYFSALRAAAKEHLSALSKAIQKYNIPEAESLPDYRSFDDALRKSVALQRRSVWHLSWTSTHTCQMRRSRFLPKCST